MIKHRRKILLVVIAFLIVWLVICDLLPVGSGDWNGKQIQKINSAPIKSSFCFAAMADNHSGLRTFRRIVKDVNARQPLFAIDVGDLVSDGVKGKYRIFYNEIKKIKVPFLTALGNHDIREKGRANYFDIFGNFYYSFSYGDSLFVVLDDANTEYIDQQQMDFLESNLKKDFQHKFVFLHVPLFDPRDYVLDIPKIINTEINFEHGLANEENVNQFAYLMKKYKATAVFSGHIHGYFEEKKSGIPYIITGGAGGVMVFANPEHYFYHYVNVCVDGDQVNYEVIKFPSPDNNLLDRWSYASWLFVWHAIATHKTVSLLFVIFLTLIFDFTYQIKK